MSDIDHEIDLLKVPVQNQAGKGPPFAKMAVLMDSVQVEMKRLAGEMTDASGNPIVK